MPVFFLYFVERTGFDQALTLAAIYYLAVVILEIPSGYLSDRVGRRPVLLMSCACLLLASAGFVLATAWWTLAICQTLLAGAMAFRSGSDSALLHDSLAALGRTSEYGAREAQARTVSQLALAASCLLGGGLGSVDLRLPYAFGALAAFVALLLVWSMREPPSDDAVETGSGDSSGAATTANPAAESAARSTASSAAGASPDDDAARGALARGLGDPLLRWLLLWYVLAFCLAHVSYEFYQPWIRLLGDTDIGRWLAGGDKAPVVSGVTSAVVMVGGALGAMVSMRLAARMRLSSLLLLANILQLIIIVSLAVALHPVLLLFIFGRNFAMSMTHAPVLAAIAPRVRSRHRATWLSIQSFVGRLGFSVVLFVLSGHVDAALDWPSLSRVLLSTAAVSGLLVVVVWWFGPRQEERVAAA